MFKDCKYCQILLLWVIVITAQSSYCQELNADSIARSRIRSYLASLYNLQITSTDFVLNKTVVLNTDPYMSTEDCGETMTVRYPTMCDSCGSGELLFGHLFRTNLYCLYSKQSKMCSNISSLEEFNQVAQKLSTTLTIAERGLLYLVLSNKHLNYWIIDNWSSIHLTDRLFGQPFFNDKVTARLNEAGVKPLMNEKKTNQITFFLKTNDIVKRVVLRFSKNGELIGYNDRFVWRL